MKKKEKEQNLTSHDGEKDDNAEDDREEVLKIWKEPKNHEITPLCRPVYYNA